MLKKQLIDNFNEAKATHPEGSVDPNGKFCVMFPTNKNIPYLVIESIDPLKGKFGVWSFNITNKMIGESRVMNLDEFMEIHVSYTQGERLKQEK
jgi:hypothetical protein